MRKEALPSAFVLVTILALFLSSCGINTGEKPGRPDVPSPRNPFGEPATEGVGAYDVWEDVWCPDAQNSGKNFRPLKGLEELPVDPIGDGVNNCYMAAYDTSRWSTDGKPVKSCANLNLSSFGAGYVCVDVHNQSELEAAFSAGENVVAVINNDITGIERFWAGGRDTKSLYLIGAYDETTKRPVLIQGDFKFAWKSEVDENDFTVVNLRLRSTNQCFATAENAIPTKITITWQSVTAKCNGRFGMFSPETPTDPGVSPGWKAAMLERIHLERTGRPLPEDSNGNGLRFDEPGADMSVFEVNDRYYLRNVMTRGGSSHTIYFDHNYLTWIEDSIIMTPMQPGKHAVKLIGQNNVVHNSIFSNAGLHNEPLVDPEMAHINPHPKDGGMASFSLIACSRVLLDRVTIFHRFRSHSPGAGHSNIVPMMWQERVAVNGNCDIPYAYTAGGNNVPYKGPAIYLGRRYEKSPYWEKWFWDRIQPTATAPYNDPDLLTSFVTGVDVRYKVADEDLELYGDATYPAAVTNIGSHPVAHKLDAPVRKGFYFPENVPWWKERMRVIFNNNAFDQMAHPTECDPRGIGPNPGSNGPYLDPEKWAELKAIQKCFFVGPNTRDSVGEVDPAVRQGKEAFLGTLPPPPWEAWDRK